MKYNKRGMIVIMLLLFIVLFSLPAAAAKPDWYKASVGRKYFLEGERWEASFKNTEKVTYTFSSNRPEVIKVGKRSGKIKALAKGKAVITIQAKRQTSKGVLIYRRNYQVQVSAIRLNKTEITIWQGNEKQLVVKGSDYVRKRTVEWKSLDPSIAVVDHKGYVKGIQSGDAVITVKVGTCKPLICLVHVQDEKLPDVGSIVLINKNGAFGYVSLSDMMKGEMRRPGGSFSWEISDPLIGQISNGMYHAVDVGVNEIIGRCGRYTKRFVVQSKKWTAHRGFMDRYPENSIRAFEEAAKAGCYCMESDVRFTSDGVPVMLHDRKLESMTSGNGKVDKRTYEEVQQCMITRGNGIAGCPDRHIPTLQEFLQICKQYGVVAMVELKKMNTDEATMQEQCRIVRQTIIDTGMYGQTVILSSYLPELTTFLQVDGGRLPCVSGNAQVLSAAAVQGVIGIIPFVNNPFGITLDGTDSHPLMPATGLPWNTFRETPEEEKE